MIYLLEDDSNIRKFVLYALKSAGLEAEGFALPSEFYAAMKREACSLLLLDIMLPEEDGISILKKLRENAATARLPVIMLTARDTEYDKVIGLDSGADDYIAKPFATMELISRVKALLRRSAYQEGETQYRLGSLYVCPETHTVRVDGAPVTLTLKEFELLALLIQKPDHVYTRETLFAKIWDYPFECENRTLDVHIRTLRAKLGACGGMIQTIRGKGYKIALISGADHEEKNI